MRRVPVQVAGAGPCRSKGATLAGVGCFAAAAECRRAALISCSFGVAQVPSGATEVLGAALPLLTGVRPERR